MRTAGLDSSQGPTAAKYISSRKSNRSVSPSFMTSSSTAKGWRVRCRTTEESGANVVFFDGITAGEKDFSALIARLKENIDFVYYGGYYPEMGQMLRQARSVG